MCFLSFFSLRFFESNFSNQNQKNPKPKFPTWRLTRAGRGTTWRPRSLGKSMVASQPSTSATASGFPYLVEYDPNLSAFYYINRDYKQIGVRLEDCSFQRWPVISSSVKRHYFYDDDSAPRTKSATKKTLRIIRKFKKSHLVGFTERTDFGFPRGAGPVTLTVTCTQLRSRSHVRHWVLGRGRGQGDACLSECSDRPLSCRR